jgi:5-methylcytosine-specific restriction endonuclease McrA
MRRQPNRPKRYNTKPKDFITRIKDGDVLYFYKSKEWSDKRREALMRDKQECQRCKGTFDKIEKTTLTTATEVHHIKSLKEFPEKCLELINLVSLCHDCHDIIEGRWVKHEKKTHLNDEQW